MYTVLGWPVMVHKHGAVPDSFVCITAMLWHYQMHVGWNARLILAGLRIYSFFISWIPLFPLVRIIRSLLLAPMTCVISSHPAPHMMRIPKRTACFDIPFPLLSRASQPSQACMASCANYVAAAAWPGADLGGMGAWTWRCVNFALRVLSVFDLVIVFISSVWVLIVALRVVFDKSFASESEYLSWRGHLKRGFRCIATAQLISAFFRTGCYHFFLQPSLVTASGFLMIMAASVALVVALQGLMLVLLLMVCLGVLMAGAAFFWTVRFVWICTSSLLRFVRLLLTEAVLDCNRELSLPSSRSYGDDELCAICLDPLHPEGQPRLGAFITALERLRPRLRASSAMPPMRAQLVRLRRCGHAFHAACLEGCADGNLNMSSACPTCRTNSQICIWRRSRLRLQELIYFFQSEADLIVIATLLAAMLVLFVFCHVVLDLSQQWVILIAWLHKTHGISVSLMYTPAVAAFVFQFSLMQMQMSLRMAVAVTVLAAYPLALAFAAQPDLMGALASLAVMTNMFSVTA